MKKALFCMFLLTLACNVHASQFQRLRGLKRFLRPFNRSRAKQYHTSRIDRTSQIGGAALLASITGAEPRGPLRTRIILTKPVPQEYNVPSPPPSSPGQFSPKYAQYAQIFGDVPGGFIPPGTSVTYDRSGSFTSLLGTEPLLGGFRDPIIDSLARAQAVQIPEVQQLITQANKARADGDITTSELLTLRARFIITEHIQAARLQGLPQDQSFNLSIIPPPIGRSESSVSSLGTSALLESFQGAPSTASTRTYLPPTVLYRDVTGPYQLQPAPSEQQSSLAFALPPGSFRDASSINLLPAQSLQRQDSFGSTASTVFDPVSPHRPQRASSFAQDFVKRPVLMPIKPQSPFGQLPSPPVGSALYQ